MVDGTRCAAAGSTHAATIARRRSSAAVGVVGRCTLVEGVLDGLAMPACGLPKA
jgi:hypothetical protein